MAPSTPDPEYVAQMREQLGVPRGSVTREEMDRVERALENGEPIPGTAADRRAVEQARAARKSRIVVGH